MLQWCRAHGHPDAHAVHVVLLLQPITDHRLPLHLPPPFPQLLVKIGHFDRMVASQVANNEPPPALLTALELLSRLLSHNPATSIAAICPQLNALLEFCFNTR